MDGFLPFRASAPAFAISAAPTAPVSATLLGSGLSGDVVLRLMNNGAADVALSIGPTSAAAVAGAVFPVLSGAPQNVTVLKGIAGGWQTGITVAGPFIFAAAITDGTGSTTLFAQAGFGFVGS